MKKLTKTDFILYRDCPNNVWVKWHRPEEYAKFEQSEFEKSLAVMGNEVEELARGMFPGGYLIEKRSDGAQELTRQLIAARTPVIFQAVFSTDLYLAATDVLKWNPETNRYDIYEIKMSSAEAEDAEDDDGKPKPVNRKREEQYEYDLAFQVNVAALCGVTLGKKYLARLSRSYVRDGALDFAKLFELTDKTAAVDGRVESALEDMAAAHRYLSAEAAPEGRCPCYDTRGRSAHCTTFSVSNPGVPEYSVHDLNRIGASKRYLKELIDEGVLHVGDVPEDDRLSPKEAKAGEEPKKPRRLNQVRAHKTQRPIEDIEAIRAELEQLRYPLYFLDYETYPTAIPPWSGYRPYQHIVFQYSLHVVRSRDAQPEHHECLVLDGDPAQRIAESLRENIGDTGTVVSWFKHFENARNRELACLVPAQAEFLNGLVDRTYDLMDIVDHQHYVHPGFRGSASIKKVQPVLAPGFAYKELGVKSGTDAIEAYRQMTTGALAGAAADEKRRQMLRYCEYDTAVMYEIWKFFTELTEQHGA